MRRARARRSVSGVKIRLTPERWRHIVSRHPELEPFIDAVLATLSSPDFVVKGRVGELIAVRLLPKLPIRIKHLMVAYKELDGRDGFVITAHFISNVERILNRGVHWRRKSL